MRVHHLDCATMCPLGGARAGGVDRMVGHVLLIEAPGGLVLVDTGFGTHDRRRLPLGFRLVSGPVLEPASTALHRVRALGHDPKDVRDIVLTHLDLDHAGGLSDFPEARVHVQAAERAAARERASLRERLRYVPSQWAHGPAWVEHEASGEGWKGFRAVRAIPGLPPEILLVPLGGHTRGHQGVAIDTGEGWLLHAGDLYFHRDELRPEGRAPRGLAWFEAAIAHDRREVRTNQARLRELARGGEVTVFSAHDEREFAALAARDLSSRSTTPRR